MTNIVIELDTGTGLSGGPIIGGVGTISLTDITDAEGSFVFPIMHINAQGQSTSFSSQGYDSGVDGNLVLGPTAGPISSSSSFRTCSLGYGSLASMTGPYVRNTSVGRNCLSSLTNGDDNSAFGANAGLSVVAGFDNILFGDQAASSSSNLSGVIAFGRSVMGAVSSNITNNIGIGVNSLGLSSGSQNIGIGIDTLQLQASGSSIAIGHLAASTKSLYEGCIFIGAFADATTNVSYSNAIGHGASVSQSNSTVLGSNVNVGINTSSPEYLLDIAYYTPLPSTPPGIILTNYHQQDAVTPDQGCVLYLRTDTDFGDNTTYSLKVVFSNGAKRTLSSHVIP